MTRYYKMGSPVPPVAGEGIPKPDNGISYGNPMTHPGGPRGTDTVPAWLTEGEFVNNEESANLFAPELEQMNEVGKKIQFLKERGYSEEQARQILGFPANGTASGGLQQMAQHMPGMSPQGEPTDNVKRIMHKDRYGNQIEVEFDTQMEMDAGVPPMMPGSLNLNRGGSVHGAPHPDHMSDYNMHSNHLLAPQAQYYGWGGKILQWLLPNKEERVRPEVVQPQRPGAALQGGGIDTGDIGNVGGWFGIDLVNADPNAFAFDSESGGETIDIPYGWNVAEGRPYTYEEGVAAGTVAPEAPQSAPQSTPQSVPQSTPPMHGAAGSLESQEITAEQMRGMNMGDLAGLARVGYPGAGAIYDQRAAQEVRQARAVGYEGGLGSAPTSLGVPPMMSDALGDPSEEGILPMATTNALGDPSEEGILPMTNAFGDPSEEGVLPMARTDALGDPAEEGILPMTNAFGDPAEEGVLPLTATHALGDPAEEGVLPMVNAFGDPAEEGVIPRVPESDLAQVHPTGPTLDASGDPAEEGILPMDTSLHEAASRGHVTIEEARRLSEAGYQQNEDGTWSVLDPEEAAYREQYADSDVAAPGELTGDQALDNISQSVAAGEITPDEAAAAVSEELGISTEQAAEVVADTASVFTATGHDQYRPSTTATIAASRDVPSVPSEDWITRQEETLQAKLERREWLLEQGKGPGTHQYDANERTIKNLEDGLTTGKVKRNLQDRIDTAREDIEAGNVAAQKRRKAEDLRTEAATAEAQGDTSEAEALNSRADSLDKQADAAESGITVEQQADIDASIANSVGTGLVTKVPHGGGYVFNGELYATEEEAAAAKKALVSKVTGEEETGPSPIGEAPAKPTDLPENVPQGSVPLTGPDGGLKGYMSSDGKYFDVNGKPITPQVDTESEGQLKGIFDGVKDFFDLEDSDFKKFLFGYLGSRIVGYDHGSSLRWAGKFAIKSIDARQKAERTRKAELIKDNADKFTPESLKAYVKSGNPDDLVPVTVSTQVTLGALIPGQTLYAGGQQISVYKDSDGKGAYVNLNGTPMSVHEFKALMKKGNVRVQRWDNDIHSFEKVSDEFGQVVSGEVDVVSRNNKDDKKVAVNSAALGQEAGDFYVKFLERNSTASAQEVKYQVNQGIKDYMKATNDFQQGRSSIEPGSLEGFMNKRLFKLNTSLPYSLVANTDANKVGEFTDLVDSSVTGPSGERLSPEDGPDYYTAKHQSWQSLRGLWGAIKHGGDGDKWEKAAGYEKGKPGDDFIGTDPFVLFGTALLDPSHPNHQDAILLQRKYAKQVK